MKYGVPVHVRSSFSDAPGTWVVGEEKSLEDVVVAGVAYDKSEAACMLVGGRRQARRRGRDLRRARREEHLGRHDHPERRRPASADATSTDVTFTVAEDRSRARQAAHRRAGAIGRRQGLATTKTSSRCRSSGLGMRSHAGIAARMFQILADEAINIQAISTSEIKISCLIASKYTELAVRALHDGFGLDKATQAPAQSDPDLTHPPLVGPAGLVDDACHETTHGRRVLASPWCLRHRPFHRWLQRRRDLGPGTDGRGRSKRRADSARVARPVT